MKRRNKTLAIVLCAVVLIGAIIPFAAYKIVADRASDRVYDNVDSIPFNEVGMVLGTNPMAVGGYINPYFADRIDAVVDLYNAGKIKYILISGDNSRKEYSEPDVMRDSLVARGIPAEVIYLDYAGFRTLDSVVRAKHVFGLNKLTVISQRFHNERSIFLGDWQGINLIGYNAKESTQTYYRIKNHLREGLARVKLFLDMLIGIGPKFLGKQIPIGKGMPQQDINNPTSPAFR